MANDEQRNNKTESDFLVRLFGDAADMSNEDVELLYEVLSSGEPASTAVYEAAEAAAVEFRRRGVVPPDHTQAALDVTRPQTTLQGAKLPFLKKLVQKLGQPVTGPVADPTFSFRGLKGITQKDQETLSDLTKELEQEWDEEEEQ